MAQVGKIDSNSTGLRIAEEASLGTLPGTPVWYPYEPNSYSDFGPTFTSTARNPINDSRQRRKGVITDQDAVGGFNMDVTQDSLYQLSQGFVFASHRKKDEVSGSIAVDGTGEQYEKTDIGTGTYLAGDLIFAKNFTNSANNGLKRVTAVAANELTVAENLVTESADTDASLRRVGFQFASGDATIDAAGSLPALVTTTKDLTQLDLVPGEWIFIGGDAAGEKFATAANNGFARVRSVAAQRVEFDKTAGTMVTDAGTSKTIRVFFGVVVKNEAAANIVRRTYQMERTLGAPDDGSPSQIQSEYIVAIPNTLQFNFPLADKVTADLSFVGTEYETRDGPTGVKSGTRPALVDEDAYNTTTDLVRIKLATTSGANPSALIGYVTEMTLSINNNVSPNKALGVLGAFDATAGTFAVDGSIQAYFSNVSAIEAVKANGDISLDIHLVRDNKGISIDIPLISLGEGRANIVQDQPISLPLSLGAARGAPVDPNLDHTFLMVFYDYLPTAADS